MNIVAERVHDETEGPKVEDERDDNGVKESLFGENVGELGVEEHEANGHREIDPRLQERYNLS